MYLSSSIKRTLFLIVIQSLSIVSYAQLDTLLLWPGGAPGAKGTLPEDKPAIIPYFAPADKYNGTSIIMFPGGAYYAVAFGEGEPAAYWLNSLGINVFMVRYRCAVPHQYRHPIEINDGERAVRYVKSRAAEWKIDTTRLGIMGFSAGGHMASTVLTHPLPGKADTTDLIERFNTKLSFAMFVYPVITFQGPHAHGTCKYNVLGPQPSPKDTHNYLKFLANVQYLSAEANVTKDTPPNFLTHADNDGQVDVENSIMFRDSCKAKGVSSTLRLLHVESAGYLAHGFGTGGSDTTASIWLKYAEHWLDSMGLLKKVITSNNIPSSPNEALTVSSTTEDYIRIDYNGNSAKYIYLYNSQGYPVKHIEVQPSKNSYEVAISSYPSGVYIVKTDDAKTRAVKFLVK